MLNTDKHKLPLRLNFVLSRNASRPSKAHKWDACWDLYSNQDLIIEPKQLAVVDTGVAIGIPHSFFGAVYGRSGLTSHGILTPTGIIDSEYTGTIKVMLYNTTDNQYEVNRKDRIGQFCLHKVYNLEFNQVPELPSTARGSNGFGSTGYSGLPTIGDDYGRNYSFSTIR